MSPYELKTDAGLRVACQAAALKVSPEWHRDLKAALKRVRAASDEERATLAFQRWLWDDNPVSSPGQGQISVDGALNDEGFRRWLAKESVRVLPDGRPEREAALTDLYEKIQSRLQPFCDRMPHLKIFRVLALLFPLDFTTIADRGALTKLRIFMIGSGKLSPVVQHARIRQRLDEVLGVIDANNLDQMVERLMMPWMLYALVTESDQEPTVTVVAPGEARLVPLPAVRRRRGLTAIKGMFQQILSILEVVGDGMTREELMQYLRTTNPKSKDTSHATTINVLKCDHRHRKYG